MKEKLVYLTQAEVMALADAAQLILATQQQYAHVPAIWQHMEGLATARSKLFRAALRPDPEEGWSEEADGTFSPPVNE